MEALHESAAAPTNRGRIRLAVLLLAVGLAGHLFAAHGTGGRPLDYQHHIAGFLLLSVVSGAILAALGLRFWKGQHHLTLLLVGALQALLGLLIYLGRFSIADAG